jgi:hypothetical protein
MWGQNGGLRRLLERESTNVQQFMNCSQTWAGEGVSCLLVVTAASPGPPHADQHTCKLQEVPIWSRPPNSHCHIRPESSRPPTRCPTAVRFPPFCSNAGDLGVNIPHTSGGRNVHAAVHVLLKSATSMQLLQPSSIEQGQALVRTHWNHCMPHGHTSTARSGGTLVKTSHPLAGGAKMEDKVRSCKVAHRSWSA